MLCLPTLQQIDGTAVRGQSLAPECQRTSAFPAVIFFRLAGCSPLKSGYRNMTRHPFAIPPACDATSCKDWHNFHHCDLRCPASLYSAFSSCLCFRELSICWSSSWQAVANSCWNTVTPVPHCKPAPVLIERMLREWVDPVWCSSDQYKRVWSSAI